MKKFFSFVKIEHTLFSLPVIYSGMALGIRATHIAAEKQHSSSGLWTIAAFILIAATGARTFGFAMNRIVDWRIDAKNPRTANRELPTGRISIKEAVGVMVAGAIIYFYAASQINWLCLALSPIPLVVFLLYPFMKRFTSLAHFGVGLSLALGPLGAYFAVRPSLDGALPAILLSTFTWLWVSGFDIIYATSDEEFDKREGLHSLPSAMGSKSALRVSAVLHILAFLLLAGLYYVAFRGSNVAGSLLLISGILLYLEQRLATDVDLAFFKINAVLGFVVLFFVLSGVFLG